MSGPSTWDECRFRDDDGSLEQPHVHDNFVYAMSVHLEDHFLVLHSEYRDGDGPSELVDVRFGGVIAHHFDDVASPSILLDIERVPVDWVVQRWGRLFESRRNYGWPPVVSSDPADLSVKLTARGVSGYRVMGSCGLDGFVLATSASYRLQSRPAEFV